MGKRCNARLCCVERRHLCMCPELRRMCIMEKEAQRRKCRPTTCKSRFQFGFRSRRMLCFDSATFLTVESVIMASSWAAAVTSAAFWLLCPNKLNDQGRDSIPANMLESPQDEISASLGGLNPLESRDNVKNWREKCAWYRSGSTVGLAFLVRIRRLPNLLPIYCCRSLRLEQWRLESCVYDGFVKGQMLARNVGKENPLHFLRTFS
jgi:hypothetical protein